MKNDRWIPFNFKPPGTREDYFYFNNPKIGWFWTNSASYPQLRNMQTKEWVDAGSISASIF